METKEKKKDKKVRKEKKKKVKYPIPGIKYKELVPDPFNLN